MKKGGIYEGREMFSCPRKGILQSEKGQDSYGKGKVRANIAEEEEDAST